LEIIHGLRDSLIVKEGGRRYGFFDSEVMEEDLLIDVDASSMT